MADIGEMRSETSLERQERVSKILEGDSGVRVGGMLRSCSEGSRFRYVKMAEKAAKGSLGEAIRLKCLECVCFNSAEVEQCPVVDCALHGVRNTAARQATREGNEPLTPQGRDCG